MQLSLAVPPLLSVPLPCPSFATAICTDFSLSFQVSRSHCNHRIAVPSSLPPCTFSPLLCLEFCLMSAIFSCRYSCHAHLFSAHTPRGRVCLHY